MIIITHKNGRDLIEIIRNEEKLQTYKGNLVEIFWKLCADYPEELILWKEEGIELELSRFKDIFQHDLIMASYPSAQFYIPDSIGYVDQLPFVNPNREVKYPTWKMSADAGGIFAKTVLCFKNHFSGIQNFSYLINSIAKAGQQNSLLCYSDPQLIKHSKKTIFSDTASTGEIFSFVAQHYKKVRLLILFFCLIKYEHKFPIWSLIMSVFKKSFFKLGVDLPVSNVLIKDKHFEKSTIDVIIPTIGRPHHLRNVLHDLKKQSKLPSKVIIVEQNPEKDSKSELDYLKNEIWPFEIIHHFTHRTGACNARNIALRHISATWVFFADDDIRFQPDLLFNSLIELNSLKVNSINFNCLNPGNVTIFNKIKQWGSFGSGSSIVESEKASKCYFRPIYEHGYGEDADFGMQLRNLGVDIVYHPELQVNHLKASIGGLRNKFEREWENENILPKPSPTLMAYCLRYYSDEEVKGFKINLFLKYFLKQEIKNPVIYFKKTEAKWKKSTYWAKKIMDQEKIEMDSEF